MGGLGGGQTANACTGSPEICRTFGENRAILASRFAAAVAITATRRPMPQDPSIAKQVKEKWSIARGPTWSTWLQAKPWR